jgi:hypothetical protein
LANDLYRKGAQRILSGSINLAGDDIVALLMKAAYVPSMSADEFVAQINADQLGAAVSLTAKSVLDGAFDAADATFLAIAAGENVDSVVLAKNTGDPATSPLLAYIDVLTGFPFATNGGDIVIQWNNGATKIFSLLA